VPTCPPGFNIEGMPCFAGWRNGWLKLHKLSRAAGLPDMVLSCDVRWQNGTAHPAFITRDGDLVCTLRREDRPLDEVARPSPLGRQRTVVSMSHRLTADEISTASRGVVHGSVATANDVRSVSHVVEICDETGELRCMRFGEANAAGAVLTLARQEAVDFAPQLIREYEDRTARMWTRKDAAAVHPYVEALFSRAHDNDVAVRELMCKAAAHDGTTGGAHAAGLVVLERLAGALGAAAASAGKSAARGGGCDGGQDGEASVHHA
jgi:hypothetical protein